ncbi:DUF6112 family protein [Salana multivorans]
MCIFPDFDGLGGIGDLRAVVGALLTFVLIVAVLMLIVSAIVWAIATAHGNYAQPARAKSECSSLSAPPSSPEAAWPPG